MADETPTTGTTPAVDGDAATLPTTGTTEGAGRNAETPEAIAGSGITVAEALAWKAKAERLNEIERQERERASQPAPAADESQGRGDQIAALAKQAAILEAKSAAFSAEGDPVAGLALLTRAEQLRERAERLKDQEVQQLAWQLRETPEAYRAEVYETFKRGGFADVSAARAHVERGKLQAENEALKRQIAAANKQPEATSVPTGGREAPAPTTNITKMTRQEFLDLQARTRAEKGHFAAMDLQGKIGSEIQITG